jgi:predicted MFS family arabinose efflux permease
MRAFGITPAQFSVVVSSYTLVAGISGFLGAFFLDRFDRKSSLQFLYGGFVLGTLLCGLATSYVTLLAARSLTGAFGGLLAATVFSTVGDVIPAYRRGRAMGIVSAAFSAASIAGVPFGIFLAEYFDWHGPFFFLAGFGVLVQGAIYLFVPQVRGHLAGKVAESPLQPIIEAATTPQLRIALSLIPSVMLAQFLLFPFFSTSLVMNVGVTNQDLSLMYMLGGAATLFTSPRVGKLSDRVGAAKVFTWAALAGIFPILILTHLRPVPIFWVLTLTTTFFVVNSARMVPSMALVTSAVSARRRGGFMSLNSCAQNIAAGLSALIGGMIVTQEASGRLQNFEISGYIAIVLSLASIWIARRVRSVD